MVENLFDVDLAECEKNAKFSGANWGNSLPEKSHEESAVTKS
jgi:hypothetical protein